MLDTAHAALEVVCFAESFMDRAIFPDRHQEVMRKGGVIQRPSPIQATHPKFDNSDVSLKVSLCVAEVLGT